MSGTLIALEGLDGSGKSTCARRVAQVLGAHCTTTPSAGVRRFRDAFVAEPGVDADARQCFYLSAVIAESHVIAERLANGESVVVDRYFLSTVAFAEAYGARLKLDHAAALVVPADTTVFLDVPLAVRRARIEARGMTAADLDTLDPTFDAAVREAYLRRAELPVVGRWCRVDGTQTPGAVVEAVLRAVLGEG